MADDLDHIVVVGGSLAGLRAAEALRREGFDGRLTMVSAEDHEPYDRPPLSKQVLAGDWTDDRTALRREPDIEYDQLLGTRAAALDLGNREVELDDGRRLRADGVVVATGASVRMLPGSPKLDGIHVLRTLEDCIALRDAFAAGPHVVVIGAGFIGSEVASTARKLGLEVTVLEALPVPLERALGPQMGAACSGLHTDNGTHLRLSAGVSGFEGRGAVKAVLLTDGTLVEAEVVVVGVGVAPNTGWLDGSGLTINNGLVCDDRCRALGSDGRVVAAGDVARWHNPLFGVDMRVEHWTNAADQGSAAAKSLLRGDDAEPYAPVPYFWSDQYGTKIQYVGHAAPDDTVRVVEGSIENRKFVAAYGRGDIIVGALIMNWPAKIVPYQRLIADRAMVPEPQT